MKHIITAALITVLSSCDTNDHVLIETQSLHDDVIQRDLLNKQTELNILRELYIAQQHGDEDAFVFFTTEYVRVPRLKLTIEQKQHPDYKEWLSDDLIKSGDFMNSKYNFID